MKTETLVSAFHKVDKQINELDDWYYNLDSKYVLANFDEVKRLRKIRSRKQRLFLKLFNIPTVREKVTL